MRYMIIGNSAAAVHAVEAIRGADKEGEITICSDEEVTFGRHNALILIGLDDSNRTYHDTHPTPHAPLSIVQDTTCLPIHGEGPGQTCLNTGRLLTVSALQGKGYRALLLEDNARYRPGILTLIRLENIL